MRRQLFLVVVCVVGCRADDAPPSPMAKAGPVEVTAARIALEDGPWIDVVVDGADEEGREACESLVNAEVRNAGAVGRARIERACEASALPAMPRGGYVLVDERLLDSTDALLAGRAARDATVTMSTRFADRAACEDARRLLAEIAARDHVGTAESERRFLHDQLERAEREETERCAEAAVAADSAIERDHKRRNCAGARAEVASLKKRIATAEVAAPAVTPGECRAE